jgi:hypothetical protein
MIGLVVQKELAPGDVERALVDAAEGWRQRLAAQLIREKPSISPSDVELAVRRTIGRMLFSRLCEQRGAEPHGLLRLVSGNDIVEPILDQFSETERFAASFLPADILGQVYERLMAAASLALAPSRRPARAGGVSRKSMGVYYTPRVVVDYVVQGAVGRLLESATPSEACHLRILDPACGSGFFLLGAYQHLLDWHLAWYLGDGAEKHGRGPSPALGRDRSGAWALTTGKRRDILQNSIFGVDVDGQAVEVTKLSLVLKLLEETLDDTGNSDPNSFASAGVCELARNIQCGDSLVDEGGDPTAQPRRSKRDGVRPFQWTRQFASVFAGGGFDAVIGNPPYISYGGRQSVPISAERAAYFEKHYESAGWATTHSFFMERAAKLLSKRLVSFIVPDQVGHLDGYRSLREILLRHGGLLEVKYWGEKVFAGVTTPALTFVWDREGARDATRIRAADNSEQMGAVRGGAAWTVNSSSALLEKLAARAMSIRPWLADCGIRTTNAHKQVVPLARAESRCLTALEGKQIGRYWCTAPEIGVRLDAGDVFKSKDEKYQRARFLIRQTAAYPIVGPRDHTTHFRNSLHALYEPDDGLDVRYLVGVLNSKVLRFAYVKTIREARQKAFPQVKLAPLGQLPVRRLDLGRAADKAAHDRVVDMVEVLLGAHRELRERDDATSRASLRRKAAEVDASLDAEVFRLYDLERGEIAEIEATMASIPVPPPAP